MKNTIIATSTYYRASEDPRFEYAQDLVKKGVAEEYPVVVVDESPDRDIARILRELGAEVYEHILPKMGPCRRQVFGISLAKGINSNGEIKYILWTEPEKHTIVQWIPKIIEPLERNEAFVSVPARTEESWKTYPAFQRASETVGNMVYNKTTGMDVDIFTGPLAYRLDVDHHFRDCHPQEFGAEDTYVQHYATIQVWTTGGRVVSVPIDLEYDPRQKAEEEGADLKKMVERRNWQLVSLVDGYFKISRHLRLRP